MDLKKHRIKLSARFGTALGFAWFLFFMAFLYTLDRIFIFNMTFQDKINKSIIWGSLTFIVVFVTGLTIPIWLPLLKEAIKKEKKE
jgi:hypothetical protein